jgi:hypothetical protein
MSVHRFLTEPDEQAYGAGFTPFSTQFTRSVKFATTSEAAKLQWPYRVIDR